MKIWNERPFEIRNLFNPAFCALILVRSIQGYEEVDKNGLPFSLALLVLPICLHKETRELIIARQRSYFLKAIGDTPQILVGIDNRIRGLLAYTFEGLGYAMSLQLTEVTMQGRFKSTKTRIRSKLEGTLESVECQKAARIIARKIAEVGDRTTIYTSLGIRL
jgi:hypothetical protein